MWDLWKIIWPKMSFDYAQGSTLRRKNFKCQIRGKSFLEKRNLIRHNVVHSVGRNIKFQICGKSFCQKIYLTRQNVICPGERIFKCDLYVNSFHQKSYMITHKTHSLHSGEKDWVLMNNSTPWYKTKWLPQGNTLAIAESTMRVAYSKV